MSYLDNIYNFNNYEYLNPSQNKYGNLEHETPATGQVVTTDELKSQLRIDSNDENTLLATYISAATQMAENYCNRHFLNARYKLYFYENLPDTFSLYYPDVTIDISSSSALERDGLFYRSTGTSDTTGYVSVVDFYVNKFSNPCYVGVINFSYSPDQLSAIDPANYMFRFHTGMGSQASDIPDAIKQAIKLIASDMYYFREDRKRAFPMASEILLQPYKCYL
mgnify:CR=1 FL=1